MKKYKITGDSGGMGHGFYTGEVVSLVEKDDDGIWRFSNGTFRQWVGKKDVRPFTTLDRIVAFFRRAK